MSGDDGSRCSCLPSWVRHGPGHWSLFIASFLFLSVGIVGCSNETPVSPVGGLERSWPVPAKPWWERSVPAVASYRIEAKLEPGDKAVSGKVHLTWRNETSRTVRRMPFHLYMNAFQNEESLFLREARTGGLGGMTLPKSDWGNIRVDDVTVDGTRVGMTIQRVERAPLDQTVAWVDLPQPVPPGGRVELSARFRTKFPKIVARTGYGGDFFMVAQWFPKVGVLTEQGWRCEPFHAYSEFFSDFGAYDVEMTLPEGYEVVATGMETGRKRAGGAVVYSFHADRVHDFALAAGRDMVVIERTVDHVVGPGHVELAVLTPIQVRRRAGRQLDILAQALRIIESWLGRYPYGRLSMVVPPDEALRASGMEYPTLFVTSGLNRMPGWPRMHGADGTTVHEFLHQYFQGIVATDETRHAWMDEGMTTFFAWLVMDRLFGPERSFLDQDGWTLGQFPMGRLILTAVPPGEPTMQPSWRFRRDLAYGVATYMKTALLLRSVMELVGKKRFFAMFRAYVQRWAFRHPEPAAFFDVVREKLGPEIEGLMWRGLGSAGTAGYEVSSVRSVAMQKPKGLFDGWMGLDRPTKRKGYETEVLVTRTGDFAWPVDVLFRFENGEELLRQWDGRGRWKRFRFETDSRLVWAIVDPDRKLWLDRKRLDDGFGAKAGIRAARSLSARYWMTVQFVYQILGY